MTFAQILLLPIAALMVVDMAQTRRCLSLGGYERNTVAWGLMVRLGIMRGMILWEATLLSILATVAIAFPSQWALPVGLVVELLVQVELNRRVLKAQAPARA